MAMHLCTLSSCFLFIVMLINSTKKMKKPIKDDERQPSPATAYTIFPGVTKCVLHGRESQKLICDFAALLRSPSCFPYFMLVAFEGGSIFRALLLLLSYPLLCVLSSELQMKVMIFITFCALRVRDMGVVSRAVLPKFYLENLNFRVFEVLGCVGSRSVFTSVPRVMVEGFLKDYLKVDFVQGAELHTFGNVFFTGFCSRSSPVVVVKDKVSIGEFFGAKMPDLGIGCSANLGNSDNMKLISSCKEAYVVTEHDRRPRAATILPRSKYPKPLIFHDGRLAFLPTPLASLKMFIWLPFGIILGILRTLAVLSFPYNISTFLIKASGITFRYKIHPNPQKTAEKKTGGVLYVCNHRTLLDPVFLTLALQKPLSALTYSLSRFSELIAPIRTVRLRRDRIKDAKTIDNLLKEGDLVVCPEGTTCREPYLLRFSSLFAELTDEIVPVAVNTHVTMFYATTASGFKCMDLIFFAMNPMPCYSIEVLEKVPEERTVAGGGRLAHEVANYVQRRLGDALGYECTAFTRRNKYMMLTGNEGLVDDGRKMKT